MMDADVVEILRRRIVLLTEEAKGRKTIGRSRRPS